MAGDPGSAHVGWESKALPAVPTLAPLVFLPCVSLHSLYMNVHRQVPAWSPLWWGSSPSSSQNLQPQCAGREAEMQMASTPWRTYEKQSSLMLCPKRKGVCVMVSSTCTTPVPHQSVTGNQGRTSSRLLPFSHPSYLFLDTLWNSHPGHPQLVFAHCWDL